jgi:hypothetical protein
MTDNDAKLIAIASAMRGKRKADENYARQKELIPNDDLVALLRAIERGNARRGLEGFTEEEAEPAYQWALQTVISYALYECVLAGDLVITGYRDGQPVFAV